MSVISEQFEINPGEELHRLRSFGQYSIRYLAEGGKSHEYIIPVTHIENGLKQITRSVRGARKFTRAVWADLCRDKIYNGKKVIEAALIYGGHPKGDWDSVDGGETLEKFGADGQVVRIWDPEPDPVSLPIVPEPEKISVASLDIPKEKPEESDI